jgi:pimeloyl-ACP methyl ester carboxylesterase
MTHRVPGPDESPGAHPAAARDISIDGLRWHCIDAGHGPALLLLHGFPYSGHQFRHLVPGLAAAGYRVLVPDLPGVGDSEAPADDDRSTHVRRVGDLVGLLDALGIASAVLVGHDVGSTLSFAAAQMRPDRFRALALLSTPPTLRAPARPSVTFTAMRAATGSTFYQAYFAGPEAVHELDADVRRSLRSIMFSVSGLASDAQRWRPTMADGEGFLDTVFDPPVPPSFLTDADFEHYVAQYARTGFRGALAPYRCRDRDWELGAFLAGRRPAQPALFLGGSSDPSIMRLRTNYDALEDLLPGLRGKSLVHGAGHGLPEEAPDWVVGRLLEFLAALDPAVRGGPPRGASSD